MPVVESVLAKIVYAVDGSEGLPPLVLVMGLGGSAEEWGERFVACLRPRFRLIRLHNRGVGPSENTKEDFTLQDMARDVVAVLDDLQLPRAHVLGLSMGGMIAQQVAIDFPGRVDGLVLMSTHFGGPEVVDMTDQARPIFEPRPSGESLEAYFTFVFETLTAPGFAARHPELAARFAAGRCRYLVPGPVFVNQIRALLASDRSQAVTRLRQRTLVLHGDRDCLIPVENAHNLAARIPGAQLALLSGCGHLPPWECPEVASDLTAKFLELGQTPGDQGPSPS